MKFNFIRGKLNISIRKMQSLVSILDKAAVEIAPILQEYHREVCRALTLAETYYICTCHQDEDEKHEGNGCMLGLFRSLWRYVVAGETKAPYSHPNFRFPDTIDFSRAQVLSEKIVELLNLFAGTSSSIKTIIAPNPLSRNGVPRARIGYYWETFITRASPDDDEEYFVRDLIIRYCLIKCGEGSQYGSLLFST